MFKFNSFSKLSFFKVFIKIKINNLINRINSFTFISFINKNDLKDENKDVNFLIMK